MPEALKTPFFLRSGFLGDIGIGVISLKGIFSWKNKRKKIN